MAFVHTKPGTIAEAGGHIEISKQNHNAALLQLQLVRWHSHRQLLVEDAGREGIVAIDVRTAVDAVVDELFAGQHVQDLNSLVSSSHFVVDLHCLLVE